MALRIEPSTGGAGPGHRSGRFDVAAVRALYPALADGHAYLDGAAGTQVPVSVIEAIAAAYRAGIGNLGGAFAASGRCGRDRGRSPRGGR